METHISNGEHSFYRVYFSGQQIIIVRAFAQGIVKKLSDDPRDINFLSKLDLLEDDADTPDLSPTLKRDVATFVANTPVEFGCLDIMHDGHDNHYIVDLNLTPYGGSSAPDAELSAYLRAGITDPRKRKPAHRLGSPLT